MQYLEHTPIRSFLFIRNSSLTGLSVSWFANSGHAGHLGLVGVSCVKLSALGGCAELGWGLKMEDLVFATRGIKRIKNRIPVLMNICLSYEWGDFCHLVKNNKQLNKALSLRWRTLLFKESYNKTTSNKVSNKLPVPDYSFLQKWKERRRKCLG